MGIIWGIANWVWIVIASISVIVCALIASVLARSIRGMRDLSESVELSGRLMKDSIASTKLEMEQARDRVSKLGSSDSEGSAWGDW